VVIATAFEKRMSNLAWKVMVAMAPSSWVGSMVKSVGR